MRRMRWIVTHRLRLAFLIFALYGTGVLIAAQQATTRTPETAAALRDERIGDLQSRIRRIEPDVTSNTTRLTVIEASLTEQRWLTRATFAAILSAMAFAAWQERKRSGSD